MPDISFVWGFDDEQARSLANTRLDQAVAKMRDILRGQGSEWCALLNNVIAEMKHDDESPEVATIGTLAQMGMLLVFAGEVTE